MLRNKGLCNAGTACRTNGTALSAGVVAVIAAIVTVLAGVCAPVEAAAATAASNITTVGLSTYSDSKGGPGAVSSVDSGASSSETADAAESGTANSGGTASSESDTASAAATAAAGATITDVPAAEKGVTIISSDGSVVSTQGGRSVASDTSGHTPVAAQEGINYTVSSDVYTFEGKRYRKGDSLGSHILTGYCPGETGSAKTVSGKNATARHTIAAPSNVPLGTVIILEGAGGPYASNYNGMYVVEDRGGYALESKGIFDIFFNTYDEAWGVTYAGWNYANIWVAEPVD